MTTPIARRGLVVLLIVGGLLPGGAMAPRRAGAAARERSDMRKTIPDPLPFVHGPAIAATDELAAWLPRQLDEDGAPSLVRLPVRVRLAMPPTTVSGGRIGSDDASNGLDVRLDDTALGISLADRTRQACADGQDCLLWLEGRWGGQAGGLPEPDDADSSGMPRFRVMRVDRRVTPEELAGPLYAGLAVPGAREDLVEQVDRLGGDRPMEEKQAAGRALVAAGPEAIPLLIAALGDARAYERRDTVNRMNLPPGPPPPPRYAVTPVGWRCEDLLYEIITPVVDAPDAGHFKVYSEQVLRVEDWRAFWAAHRARSLAEIHARLAPLVLAYWRAHGTTQTVR